MLSLICLLDINKDRYLFTGDSGIESLNSLGDNIKDLVFLDAPHHGRWNNISYQLIEKMAAKHCFISGSNKDEDPDMDVVKCLSEFTFNNQVEITNNPTNTWYLKFSKKTGISRHLL